MHIHCYSYTLATFEKGDLLSAFIKKLTNSEEDVGFISGAQGITQVALAFPVGFLSDKFLRQTMLRCACVIGSIALGLTCYIYVDLQHGANLYFFYGTFMLWGSYIVFSNPNLESIFADSIATGQRSRLFSVKVTVMQFSNAFGPAVSIVLFYVLGNTWKLSVLRVVLLCGCGVAILALLMLLRFDDSKSLGQKSESKTVREIEEEYQAIGFGTEGFDDDIDTQNMFLLEDLQQESFWEKRRRSSSLRQRCCSCTQTMPCCRSSVASRVKYSLITHDLLLAIGAGMTVKFFPLWFISKTHGYGLAPIQLSIGYVCAPSLCGIFSLLVQRWSKVTGRVMILILTKMTGIAALYGLALLDSDHTYAAPMVSLWVYRTAIMNCTSGISRSILMDFVTKSQRAKWNSFESVTRFTWSGSAALGGYLVAMKGYRFCFLITAIIYTVAMIPLFGILKLVPEEDDEEEDDENKSRSMAIT